MKKKDLVGQEFYFAGDWHTEPGRWRVVGAPDIAGKYPCIPADTNNSGTTPSWFWDSIVEKGLERMK